MLDYVAIGLMILVFIFELILIWYMWWVYTELNNDMNDVEDMLVDVYNISVADLAAEGKEVVPVIPKRVRQRIARKEAKKAALEASDC